MYAFDSSVWLFQRLTKQYDIYLIFDLEELLTKPKVFLSLPQREALNRSLVYLSLALLHLVSLCLVCSADNGLLRCASGYSMWSCCCDGTLENETCGFSSISLVEFWDSCKTASAVLSTHVCLLKPVLKFFDAPQHWSLILFSLRREKGKITGCS